MRVAAQISHVFFGKQPPPNLPQDAVVGMIFGLASLAICGAV